MTPFTDFPCAKLSSFTMRILRFAITSSLALSISLALAGQLSNSIFRRYCRSWLLNPSARLTFCLISCWIYYFSLGFILYQKLFTLSKTTALFLSIIVQRLEAFSWVPTLHLQVWFFYAVVATPLHASKHTYFFRWNFVFASIISY